MANDLTKRSRSGNMSQLLIPIIALALIALFNLFRDPGFFSVGITQDNRGNDVLTGNLISILNGASELANISMGMTLVTASSKGQDISVGAIAAIAGSVFVKFISGGTITGGSIAIGIILCCLVAMVCGAFNGALVAFFNIQPMIATLILFTTGRSIAYWINGGATPTVDSPILTAIGGFIPGCPVPTPIFIVIIVGVIFWLLFRFTNLRLYTQAVGINQDAARLNGINPRSVKMLTFIILGLCSAIAGVIAVARLGLINHETVLIEIEMDAILAVAIGGNSLGGGKFTVVGSVLGAYAIQALTTTLYAMRVASTEIKAYKAVVIILIVIIGSPVVKDAMTRLMARIRSRRTGGLTAKEE